MTDGAGRHDGGPLRRISLRGAAYLIGGSLGTKICTVGTQVVLGWVLSEQDFAIYGIAISLTLISSALTDGGVQKYLRQQPARYRELAGPAAVLASILAAMASMVIATLGILSDRIYDIEGIRPVVLCIAAGLLLSPPMLIARSRFAVELRFRDLAVVDTSANIARSLLMIVFALAGLGPLSLALPIPIVNCLQAAAMALWGGFGDFTLKGTDFAGVARVFRHTRWIMLSAACGTVVLRGDYLILGLLASGIVGTYFFGFQIAASTMQIATMSAASVLLPTLSRLASDGDRLALGVERATRMASLMIAPSSGLLFLSLPFVIHAVWQGRWDAAIPVAEAVAVSTAIAGLGIIAATGTEATGGWRVKSVIDLIDGCSLIAMLMVVVDAFGEQIGPIAIAIAIQRSVFGVVNIAVCGRRVRAGILNALGWILGPTLATAAGCVLAMSAGGWVAPAETLAGVAVRVAVFLVVFGSLRFGSIRSAIAEFRALRGDVSGA